MKDRKHETQNLENKKTTFFLLGLVLTLSLALYAFEWKSYERKLVVPSCPIEVGEDDEIIPITHILNPPPPPPALPEVIQIVSNTTTIIETGFEPTDIDWDDPIEIIDEMDENGGEIFTPEFVENKPVYPGCEEFATEAEKFKCFNEKIMKHIAKNFTFPEMARNIGAQGKMYVNFVIEKDGSVSNVIIARGVDKLLDDEAIRTVKTLPKFTPAKQQGKPVRMQYTVPINAKLH